MNPSSILIIRLSTRLQVLLVLDTSSRLELPHSLKPAASDKNLAEMNLALSLVEHAVHRVHSLMSCDVNPRPLPY